MFIEIYLISVMIALLSIMYFKTAYNRQEDMKRKVILLFTHRQSKDYAHPELLFFIPVVNLIVSAFLLWMCLTSYENFEKVFNEIENEIEASKKKGA